MNLSEYVDFQCPQFSVRDDEEITATAGRIKKTKVPQPLPEGVKCWNAASVTARFQCTRNSSRNSSRNSGSMTLRIFCSVV